MLPVPPDSDISLLLRFLLGREPSERAFVELRTRALSESACRIMLGNEFLTLAEAAFTDGHDLPQFRYPFPERDTLRQVARIIGTTPSTEQQFERASEWRIVLRAVIRDGRVKVRIQNDFPAHGNHARFFQLREALAPPRKPAGSDKAAAASADAPPPPARPAPAVVAAAKPEPPRSPVTVAEAPAALAPSAEIAAAERIVLAAGSGLDFRKVRSALYELYKTSSGLAILHLDKAVAEGRIANGDVAYFCRFLASRVYLRYFMSGTAFDVSDALIRDTARCDALPDSDRRRLFKVNALAAIRSGRAPRAVEIYRAMCHEYPQDWEFAYFLGSTIQGSHPEEAADWFRAAIKLNPKINRTLRISTAEFLASCGHRGEAWSMLLDLLGEVDPHKDTWLVFANMALREGNRAAWRKHVGRYFQMQGLSAADVAIPDDAAVFRFGRAERETVQVHPLISVVMTSFNAADTIGMAIGSVLDQTRSNFELIVVDDVSTDRTREVVAEWAARDRRVRYIFNDVNMGTYCSKNKGIQQAAGQFVTFHDSDDWMHPQRFEYHLAYMKDPALAASLSSWIRMTADGVAIPRKGGGFVHRNPASTFIRREVFDRIGLFDSVRTGADTELLWRMKNVCGASSVLETDDTLALGLHHENSLTMSGATAFDEHRYSEVRLRYWETWVRWQFDCLLTGRAPRMRFPNVSREFEAPDEIRVSRFDVPDREANDPQVLAAAAG